MIIRFVLALWLVCASSSLAENDRGEEKVSFNTAVTFANGSQFRAMQVAVDLEKAGYKFEISLRGDAYLYSLADEVKNQTLYFWCARDFSDCAAGWVDGENQGQFVPDEKGIQFANNTRRWDLLSEVPEELKKASIDLTFSLPWLSMASDSADGNGTIRFQKVIEMNARASPAQGGIASISFMGRSIVVSFDERDLLSVESMLGKTRDGRSLGWRKGVLIQNGTYSSDERVDGMFLMKIDKDSLSFVEIRERKETRRWESVNPNSLIIK